MSMRYADAFVFTLNAMRSPALTLMSAANPSIVALPRPSGRSHSLCAFPGFEFSHTMGFTGVAHGSEAAETVLVNGCGTDSTTRSIDSSESRRDDITTPRNVRGVWPIVW